MKSTGGQTARAEGRNRYHDGHGEGSRGERNRKEMIEKRDKEREKRDLRIGRDKRRDRIEGSRGERDRKEMIEKREKEQEYREAETREIEKR